MASVSANMAMRTEAFLLALVQITDAPISGRFRAPSNASVTVCSRTSPVVCVSNNTVL
jgi:hypothetical protein